MKSNEFFVSLTSWLVLKLQIELGLFQQVNLRRHHYFIIKLLLDYPFEKKKKEKSLYYKVTSFEAANSTGSIPVS